MPLLGILLGAAALSGAHLLRRPSAQGAAGAPGARGEVLAGQASPLEAQTVWVDPTRATLLEAPSWADPRWLEHLERVLAARALALEDDAGIAGLADRLAGLSFVQAVERCEAAAGGLEVVLSLRRPVACVEVRGEFALVDAHGVVLEGRWPLPPRLGRASLPVLGLGADPLLDVARAGDWLVEPEHVDALAVALSLEEHLDEEQRAALGRLRIDARAGQRASVSEPGVRLELEGGRVAFFGRSPGLDEPGELSESEKWLSLARALALLEDNQARWDWDLVDLRWDRPDIALREALSLASLDRSSHAPGQLAQRPQRSREPSGARVR